MGSEKYPDEEAYSGYLSEHGGYCNAYTQFESTNYQFEVESKGLEEALMRMANNFASPLLNEDAVKREVLAIESEF